MGRTLPALGTLATGRVKDALAVLPEGGWTRTGDSTALRAAPPPAITENSSPNGAHFQDVTLSAPMECVHPL
jgi:hypothetical protein